MIRSDSVTIGLTPEGHSNLQRLTKEGVFAEMLDGYRFAIGLAIRRGLLAPEEISTETIYNVGSLDRDGLIRDTVSALFAEAVGRPYAFAERLAEAGVKELTQLYDSGQLRFADLFASVGENQIDESEGPQSE